MNYEHNVNKYMFDIAEMCKISNGKFGSTGQDIHLNTDDRESARFRIPVVD